MGILLFVADVFVDSFQILGKGLSFVMPKLKNGATSLFDTFSENKRNNGDWTEIKLEELKISLVAPSGFGKTTLISSIMKEIDKTLTVTDKDKTFEMSVVPADKDDEDRLLAFDRQIDEAILAKKSMLNLRLNSTSEPYAYNFNIILSCKEAKTKIIQPFSMMDIPGGWIDPKNRTGSDAQTKWANFEEHLKQSRILWSPIDAPVLMKPVSENEKAISVRLLDTTDTQKLIQTWAKHRVSNDESCVCYIPVKCESWLSRDTSLENTGKIELSKKVHEIYEGCKRTVEDVNHEIYQYYIPVETIGCIKLADVTWNETKNEGDCVFKAEYRIDGNTREINGANLLIKKIYDYSYDEIQKAEENAEKQIELLSEGMGKVTNISKINDAKKQLKSIQTVLQPIISEFKKLGDIRLEAF